jgi:hypothetical protein
MMGIRWWKQLLGWSLNEMQRLATMTIDTGMRKNVSNETAATARNHVHTAARYRLSKQDASG